MRIVLHHNKFYDWENVPSDVKVTPSDLASGKVMPGRDPGTFKMKVIKDQPTYTEVQLPEHEVVAKVIEEAVRTGQVINRKQAVALYLNQYVLPQHAHKTWLTKFEVHDDGPEEALLRSELARHCAAGNVDADLVEQHVASYIESASASDHVDHLHKHFRVSKVAK